LSNSRRKPKPRRRPAKNRHTWVDLPDDELLDWRLRDLGLRIEGTPLEPLIGRLGAELGRRGLCFRPHVWLSSEWFSPDGIPGIAIPFFLAHPRLARLEARQMLEVEGGSAHACMRLLRHEAGHAIDTAYRLHYKKRWRETFGRFAQRYPATYRPNPRSRKFVLHLDAWYAQAHPAEDFAETFAVWLTPRSTWRTRYADWPVALRKLECVDELMRAAGYTPAPVRSRAHVEPVSQLTLTLREHYRRKREFYVDHWPDFYDEDLRRLFTNDRGNGNPNASAFLRALRRELRETVAEWTGAHPYTIDQVLQDMIERCRELRLRLTRSPARTKTQAIILLTVHTLACLHTARREIAL